MNDMIRSALITLALIAASATTSLAQFQIGGQLGIDLSGSDLFIGGNAVFDLPWQINDHTVKGNPEVSFYLLDDSPTYDQGLTMIALNGLYPVDLRIANAYFGGGLLIGLYSGEVRTASPGEDRSLDDTDIGIDLKVGVDFARDDSKIIPWAEGGLNIIDGGGLFVQGGARFSL